MDLHDGACAAARRVLWQVPAHATVRVAEIEETLLGGRLGGSSASCVLHFDDECD